MESSQPTLRQHHSQPPGRSTPHTSTHIAATPNHHKAHRLPAPLPRSRRLRRSKSASYLSSPERSPSFPRRVPPHPWKRPEDESEGYLGDDSERDNQNSVGEGRKRSSPEGLAEQQSVPAPAPASSSNTAYTGPVTPPRPTSYGLDEDFRRVEQTRVQRNMVSYVVQMRDAESMLRTNRGSEEAGLLAAIARTDDEGRLGRRPVVRSLPPVVGEDDAAYWSRITMARLGVRVVGSQVLPLQGGSTPMFLNGWLPRTMNGVNGDVMGNGQTYFGPEQPRTQNGDDEDLD